MVKNLFQEPPHDVKLRPIFFMNFPGTSKPGIIGTFIFKSLNISNICRDFSPGVLVKLAVLQ